MHFIMVSSLCSYLMLMSILLLIVLFHFCNNKLLFAHEQTEAGKINTKSDVIIYKFVI